MIGGCVTTMIIGVLVSSGVGVFVGRGLGVDEGDGVAVGIDVGDGVAVCVGVLVGTAVFSGVAVITSTVVKISGGGVGPLGPPGRYTSLKMGAATTSVTMIPIITVIVRCIGINHDPVLCAVRLLIPI